MSNNDFMAYPFLKEESLKCDYEILTDELSSILGVAKAVCKHIPELESLVEKTYHLNGSIRGKLGICEEDLNELINTYNKYEKEVQDELKQFVLPQGCIGASHLHVARAKAKMVARLMYKIYRQEQVVPRILFDYVNLLSNCLFLMALYENKLEKVDEIPFISKSY